MSIDIWRQLGATLGATGTSVKSVAPKKLRSGLRVSLTNTAIRNAKPSKKSVRLFDERGLYLEISPNGGKWWRFKYSFDGKERRMSLGVYPDVSLAEVRIPAKLTCCSGGT